MCGPYIVPRLQPQKRTWDNIHSTHCQGIAGVGHFIVVGVGPQPMGIFGAWIAGSWARPIVGSNFISESKKCTTQDFLMKCPNGKGPPQPHPLGACPPGEALMLRLLRSAEWVLSAYQAGLELKILPNRWPPWPKEGLGLVVPLQVVLAIWGIQKLLRLKDLDKFVVVWFERKLGCTGCQLFEDGKEYDLF